MICFKAVEEDLYPFTPVERWQDGLLEGYHWVHNRPVAVVHIDLNQDDSQEIAQKLDRWERLERRRTLTELTGASPALVAPA